MTNFCFKNSRPVATVHIITECLESQYSTGEKKCYNDKENQAFVLLYPMYVWAASYFCSLDFVPSTIHVEKKCDLYTMQVTSEVFLNASLLYFAVLDYSSIYKVQQEPKGKYDNAQLDLRHAIMSMGRTIYHIKWQRMYSVEYILWSSR